MRKIFTILACLICTTSLIAQVPQKMSYQAIIRDANNNLITDQSVGMQISILQGSSNGSVLYSETQNPTTNSHGLIGIEIGTGVTSDDFTTIDWGNGPYFIKTETDPEGGTNYTISGTSQLLSVPFALFAAAVPDDQKNDADADPTNEIELPETANEGANLAWNNGEWSANASGTTACMCKMENALTTYAEIGDLQFRYNPGDSESGFIEVKSEVSNEYLMIYGEISNSSIKVEATWETKNFRSAIELSSDWQALMKLWNGTSWNGRAGFEQNYSFEATIYSMGNDLNKVPPEPKVYQLFSTVDEFGNVLIRVEYNK